MHFVENNIVERRPLLGALPLSLTDEEATRAVGSLFARAASCAYRSAVAVYADFTNQRCLQFGKGGLEYNSAGWHSRGWWPTASQKVTGVQAFWIALPQTSPEGTLGTPKRDEVVNCMERLDKRRNPEWLRGSWQSWRERNGVHGRMRSGCTYIICYIIKPTPAEAAGPRRPPLLLLRADEVVVEQLLLFACLV